MKKINNKIVFNSDGLIPTITQDSESKKVLMLAWMNKESLQETLKSGKVTYWSRSRKKIWVKGETSGNWQFVKNIKIDCDGDTLLILVDQCGPACHTGSYTCFFSKVDQDFFTNTASRE